MASRNTRQFRALFRFSLARLVDLEIISSRGDLSGLVARAGGVFLGLSLVLMAMVVAPLRHFKGAMFVIQARNDTEFMISLTIAVAGLFSVLAWNNVLPDRRDALVLGVLPVPTRTIALSRLAAIFFCISALVFAMNAFTGLAFPYVMAKSPSNALRTVAAWWIAMLAAGVFAFVWTLAVQGAAAQVLRWHTFLRVSGVLQMVSLFMVLALFFLTPPFSGTLRNNPDLATWLPSYWFNGLLHALRGDQDATMRALAFVAVRNLAAVGLFAVCVFALAWFRHMRTIVETPDIASRSGNTVLASLGALFIRRAFRRPIDRAVMLFTARTATRSRQHRLLLAAYGGVGFALAVTFTRGLFSLSSSVRWTEPNAAWLVVGLLLLLCAVLATRSVFAMPHSLASNWVLRVTVIQRPEAYFDAVRKSLILYAAAPVWLACGAAWLVLWPRGIAFESILVLVLIGLILVDSSLYQFRKFPFACSWLPASGQSLNTVRALAYGCGFLISATAIGNLELSAMRSGIRFLMMAGCLGGWAYWARRRSREFNSSPGNAVQFDAAPEPEIFALDLRPDGEWSGEQAWVDAIDAG